MSSRLAGGCLCGAVRYQVDLPPIDAGYCHCRVCQRASGAPTLAWLTVPLPAFTYTAGAPQVFHSSEKAQREFCAHCGTPLVFRYRGTSRTVDVTLASLDFPEHVQPQYHIWSASRIPWFDTADSLPRYLDAGPDRHEG